MDEEENEGDVSEEGVPRLLRWKTLHSSNITNYSEWQASLPKLLYDVFSEDILEVVVEQSNLFTIQCHTNKPLYLTTKELDSFIALYHNKIWSKKWSHQLMSILSTWPQWLPGCSTRETAAAVGWEEGTYEALYFQVVYRRKPVQKWQESEA